MLLLTVFSNEMRSWLHVAAMQVGSLDMDHLRIVRHDHIEGFLDRVEHRFPQFLPLMRGRCLAQASWLSWHFSLGFPAEHTDMVWSAEGAR